MTSGPAGMQARAVRSRSAEGKALYRAGVRAESTGHPLTIWQEPPRNGMPVRLYVYRGTGEDQYAHLYDEEELCG